MEEDRFYKTEEMFIAINPFEKQKENNKENRDSNTFKNIRRSNVLTHM